MSPLTQRSFISTNFGGGVHVSSARAVLVNNIVVANGTSGPAGTSFGGISLRATVAPSSVVQSNTVAANNAAAGFTDGIDCAVAGLTVSNHILLGTPTVPRVAGTCSYDHVLYGPDDPGGRLGTANGNARVANDADLRFADPAMRDWHILPTSVAKGKGTVTGLASEAMVDMDGQTRPQGAPDVGADEIPD